MSTWRGHGGLVKVKNPLVNLPVSKWTVEETFHLANKTNSSSGGHKQRQYTVTDTAITLELPWDSDQDPEAFGLVKNAEIPIELNKGESGKKISSNKFILEKRQFVNDEDEDIVRLVLSGYSNETVVHA